MDFDWQVFFQTIFSTYGLAGMFFASMIASATILLPVPFYLFVFVLSGLADSLPFAISLGIVTGLGAGIGEMTGYLLGRVGLKAVEKTKIDLGKVFEFESKLEKRGALAIFFLAIIPVPFDFVGMAAGLIRFDFKSFFIATVAGKTIRYILISLGGYFGIEIVKLVFIH